MPKGAWTSFASGQGLDGPWGLVLEGGTLYVASFATDEILRFNVSSGDFLGRFGNEVELNCPEVRTMINLLLALNA